MELLKRLEKYRADKRAGGSEFDYKKALGEARLKEIEKIVKKEIKESCVRCV